MGFFTQMSTNGMDTISGPESKNYTVPARENLYTYLVITGPRLKVKINPLFWVITQREAVISYRRFGQPIGPFFRRQVETYVLQTPAEL